jgi:two-component system, chemotaxis family, chemotaxis protein CheY
MGLMVIDDSMTMRKILGTALKSGNYEFEEAENGKVALSKLTGQKIECFIVDFNMPEMNGIEFIKELRKKPEYNTTPVIILTTESDVALVEQGKAAGADEWLIKPFEKEKLLEVVGKLLS